jgi:hypothetical protein
MDEMNTEARRFFYNLRGLRPLRDPRVTEFTEDSFFVNLRHGEDRSTADEK